MKTNLQTWKGLGGAENRSSIVHSKQNDGRFW